MRSTLKGLLRKWREWRAERLRQRILDWRMWAARRSGRRSLGRRTVFAGIRVEKLEAKLKKIELKLTV